MNGRISRRQALGSLVAGSAGAALAMGACAPWARTGTRSGALYKRYSAFSPEGEAMLDLYEAAAAQMMVLPGDNEFSWTYQATKHTLEMEHGSWWFLPWHRAYLWYFEWIVRETVKGLPGGDRFAMPYWPWEDEACRRMPKHFRNPSSSLHDATRLMPNDGEISLRREDVQALLASCAFVENLDNAYGFGGSINDRREIQEGLLEATLHNFVHDQVGGHMGDQSVSAFDPLFWVHHSNVDRLWELWRSWGCTRGNPTDAEWNEKLYHGGTREFVRGDDRLAKDAVSAADVLGADRIFNYEYVEYSPPSPLALAAPLVNDPCAVPAAPPPSPPPPRPQPQPGDAAGLLAAVSLTKAGAQRVHLNPGPVTVELEWSDDGRDVIEKLAKLKGPAGKVPASIQLMIGGVRASGPPGVTYRVFVNNPAVTAGNSATAQGYVGTLSAFQIAAKMHAPGPGHAHAAEKDFRMALTDKWLGADPREAFDPQRTLVTFVPVGAGSNTPRAEVSVGSIEIRVFKR